MDKKSKGEYNFKKDCIKGETGEIIIKDFLTNIGFEFLKKNYDYRYDLKMSYQNRIIKYEIKTDIYQRDTGNIIIEFESRGKKSGISVTEADYFVTYFFHHGEIWNISTDKLKLMINYLKPKTFEMAGDLGSNTKLYKFKKKDVKQFFKIHKI